MVLNPQDGANYVAGIGFLALAKIKNALLGYTSPKKFDLTETDRCIDYNLASVQLWSKHLRAYLGGANPFEGKEVLELGPGSDLGTGIVLLSEGCARYHACDVNDLMASVPDSYYEKLLKRLATNSPGAPVAELRAELRSARSGAGSRLNYRVRDDFDVLAALGPNRVDLVLSQAAFEHFDDIDLVVDRLTSVSRPGASLAVQIDLKTHSRWIRQRDPNNIYRYPNWLYGRLHFRGAPNRLRPYQYKASLERAGWRDVIVSPVHQVEGDHVRASQGMDRSFAGPINQMNYLSVVICAKKPYV